MKRCLPLLVGCFLLASGAWGVELPLTPTGDRMTKRVKSWKELRQEGLILQQLDYSCGAAALATLLSFFFQDQVTEEVVIGFIFIHGQTPEEGLKKYFKRKGFSLLDLKRFATFRGYQAAGYKEMTLEDLLEILEKERVPVLVPIRPFGYHHFVVIRGIRGNRVFMADPALGHTTMTIARFLDVWVEGIGFVVTKKPLARSPGAGPPDEELAQITAAGAPSRSKAVPPPSPPLLTIKPHEPVPDYDRLHPTFQRQAPPEVPRFVQTFADERGSGLFSLFSVQNFNPVLQLGRPAGNFVDFTPPRGQSLQIRQ